MSTRDNTGDRHVGDLEVAAYLDRGLSGAERDRFEDHVAECAECGQYLIEARALLKRVHKPRRRLVAGGIAAAAAALIIVAAPLIRRSDSGTEVRPYSDESGSSPLSAYGPMGEGRLESVRFASISSSDVTSYRPNAQPDSISRRAANRDFRGADATPSQGASGTWTTNAPMPTARIHLAAAAVGNVLYAVGGLTANNCAGLQTLEAYDPGTNSWTTKAPMPTGRFDISGSAVALNGLVYIVGGDVGCGIRTAAVEAYDPRTDTWTTKTPMPTARSVLGVAVVNGVLYAIGGALDDKVLVGDIRIGGARVATVEAYDPVTDRWTTKAPMLTGRAAFAIGVVNGIIYVAGGQGGNFPNLASLSSVEAYDPVANTWTAKPAMPGGARGELQGGVVRGIFYAVGGEDAGPGGTTRVLGRVEGYNPARNAWFSGTPMLTTRPHFAIGVVGGVLYTVGGGEDYGVMATREAFTPASVYSTRVGHAFLRPLNAPPVSRSVFKIGSTIPVKFQLFLSDGVTPVSSAVATIQVNKVSGGVPSTVNETVVSTVPNQGTTFRYDTVSQQYIFNLGTKGWSPGSYAITALLDDGSQITVNIGAR